MRGIITALSMPSQSAWLFLMMSLMMSPSSTAAAVVGSSSSGWVKQRFASKEPRGLSSNGQLSGMCNARTGGGVGCAGGNDLPVAVLCVCLPASQAVGQSGSQTWHHKTGDAVIARNACATGVDVAAVLLLWLLLCQMARHGSLG